MNMCGYVFAALGEPLLGFVIDHTHHTDSIFLVICGICLLSAGVIGMAKTKRNSVEC
jgi:OPA family glycerol-3-phosphate transporter-like MFS transporter